MKEFCFALLLSLLFKVSCAQCRLSGTIDHPKNNQLQLTLLYGDGHYENPSINITCSANGKFSQHISLSNPVFAILRSGDFERRLLLSPKRDLQLAIRIDSPSGIRYAGEAAAENRLVGNSILDSIPFFMKVSGTDNPFARTSIAEWQSSISEPIAKEMRTAVHKIKEASIPAPLRDLLISETGYAYQAHLNDLTNNNMRWANNPAGDSLLKWTMNWQPMPDSATLVSGFYANMMMERRIRYSINQRAWEARRKKENVQEVLSNFFHSSFKEVDSLVRMYGEVYVVDWIYAKNYLPGSMRDKILLNKILNAANNASFNACFYLMDTMSFYFPNSPYLPLARREVTAIRDRLQSTGHSAEIRYREPGTVHSLADLVKPYAGKIVYLDIWGTWCGPCKTEMKYVKELKKQFAGKDIVFVYLDMDESTKERSWKEYLQYFGIEGEHYRMDNKEIEAIWKEIKAAGGKDGLYPTFVLFDREGRIITPDAERPSSEEKLYTQLNKVL